MALNSPGVESKESSITSTVVTNSTGRAAIVGKFQWGPAFKSVQITSPTELIDTFGEPNDDTADYVMSASNFLAVGNDLRVVRVVDVEATNSSACYDGVYYVITAGGSNYAVGDQVTVSYGSTVVESAGKVTSVDTDGKVLSVFIPSAAIVSYAKAIGQYPELGSSWTGAIISASSGVSATINIVEILSTSLTHINDPTLVASTDLTPLISYSKFFNLPVCAAAYMGELGDDIQLEIVSYDTYNKGVTNLTIYPDGGTQASTVKANFSFGPQTSDQYAVIVRRGGVIVESSILSTLQGDKDIYGNTIYIDDYFANGSSSYWFATAANWPVGFSGVLNFGGGTSSADTITAGEFEQGWDLFSDPESLRVQLLIAGAVAGEGAEFASTVQKYVSAIADQRKDCVAFISPPREILVNIPLTTAISNLVAWKTAAAPYADNNFSVSSTYTFVDGNYKYQYDKYNDVNRWIPLAADMAALCVNTDNVSYPWMSPAGYNRGQIANVIKFAIEPRQAHRDSLYENAINPVINTTQAGFILFGDKMCTSSPTPFDRINVRRLFIMLKNDIGDTANYALFELNTAFERSSFRTTVGAYLTGIETLGGIYDYRVICDTTNNTATVIDANQFIATMYIKPARSINYITLNFVATATGISFDELVGTTTS